MINNESNYNEELLEAAGNGLLKKAKKAINKGADVNCRDDFGNTPLLLAVHHKKKKMIIFLLEQGADMALKNNNGHNAFRIVMDQRNY